MKTTKTAPLFALAAALGCEGPAPEAEPATPETATRQDELVLGTYTDLRPEIGNFPGVCTGTLVSDRYVLTAAHCYNYMTGPVGGTFIIRDTSGSVIDSIPIDYHFALGGEVGPYDVSFVRLTRPAPAGVLRRSMTDASPAQFQYVTTFGFGCQDRMTGLGGGLKQFYTYGFGATTGSLCPGDSGGPQVLGFAGGTGAIWAVNSGFGTVSGTDRLGYIGVVDGIEVGRGLEELYDSRVVNDAVATVPWLTQFSDVSGLAGDFNGDGRGDVAAIGRAGYSTITVAYGDGSGGFGSTVSKSAGLVPFWSTTAPHRVAGDFDANGRTDIALLGNSAWTTIPIAFSSRSGNFVQFNKPIAYFQLWAAQAGAQAIVGDYDGDGDDDIALTGVSGWSTIPVAFSKRDGTFTVTNFGNSSFANWAATPGAQVVAGDFDGDGDDDLAVSGPNGWTSIPYASSNGDGTFVTYNKSVHKFGAWAAEYGAELVAGDFDHDGDDDIASVGSFNAPYTIALALSDGTKGGFVPAKLPLANFPGWGITAKHVRAFRMDRDTSDDIVLMGGGGWSTVPVARMSRRPVRGG